MYSKNFSGAPPYSPIERCRCLTKWAGLFSGTGNVSSHLSICVEVKTMVWKRRRRHDGIHDLDTRAHDWRDLKSESVERWSKIPSMVSCGILGMVTTLFFESIQGVDRGMSQRWALSLAWRSYCRKTGHHDEAAARALSVHVQASAPSRYIVLPDLRTN